MAEVPEILGLASAVEALRSELEAAWSAGQGRPVRFRASAVTLKVQALARREKDGTGKIRWWLIEAGGGTKAASEATQTLELTLTPLLYDENDRSSLLDISGDQTQPGG